MKSIIALSLCCMIGMTGIMTLLHTKGYLCCSKPKLEKPRKKVLFT